MIAHAQGVVKCRRCGEVFDSLATFRNHPHIFTPTPSSPEPRPVPIGDRITLVHRIGLARPVSRHAIPPTPDDSHALPLEEEPKTRPSKLPAQWISLPSVRLFRSHLGLALRNVARHRRRSVLAIGAIGFGVVALVLASGFIEWIFWAMREDTIRAQLGHIQVVRPGYLEQGTSETFSYLLPGGAPELRAIEQRANVRTLAPRLAFSGLISYGETTVSFLGEGVNPEKELTTSGRLKIIRGQNLSSLNAKEIILGVGLAMSLGVSSGDQVVLLATTSSGGINAVEARISGLFQTSTKAFDDVALRVPLPMASELLQVSGAHRWVLLLDETDQTEATLEQLRADFPVQSADLQFIPWYELSEFYNKTTVLFSRQVNVVQLIIAVIIVLSISNTLIMSVVERTGEIGTLLALGLKRRNILQLFVNEGLVLAIAGSTVGLALGIGLAKLLSIIGIPMPPPPGMAVGFTGEILVTWQLATSAASITIVATILASVYPSWKASRLEIVDALRHNR